MMKILIQFLEKMLSYENFWNERRKNIVLVLYLMLKQWQASKRASLSQSKRSKRSQMRLLKVET